VVVFGTLAGVIAVGWFVGSVRKYQFGVREPMSYGFGVSTGIALLAYLVWEIVDNVRFDRHGNPRLRWYDGKYSIGAAVCMIVVTVTWFWTFYDPVVAR